MNEPADIFGDDGTHEFAGMSAEDIRRRSRLLENEIRVLQDETPEPDAMTEQIKENREKIKLSKQLPSLVGNVVEILDVNPEDEAEEDGANVDLDSRGKGKGAGLVGDPDRLKPGDLVGVNKDSYLVLDTLPSEYDSRVEAMEVDEKPTEVSSDIGGPDKQIQNSMEAIVIPVTHKERFDNFSIPPRGVLSYSPTMEYVSALAHLTTFGILGVCIRYGLEILFSNIANVTSNDSSLFIDLPANMVGCFFMGWVGVVLKKDIAAFSGLLVIGLSTGLMGSITTYASWNQELLVLVTHGLWVRSIVGLIIGMELAQMSLSVGMDSAKLLRAGIMYIRRDRVRRGLHKKWGFSSPDNLRRQQISLLIFMATSAILWVASVVLTIIDVDSAVRRRLWLSCVVGPPGVWARWLLARLNGQGIGTNQYLNWLPVGTLLTNVVASTLQSVLATVLLAAPDDSSLLCGALQTGLLGCMSTVSTFVTEVYSLHQSPKRWRAYAYFCISFFCSYSMGALVYTLPVLVDHLSL